MTALTHAPARSAAGRALTLPCPYRGENVAMARAHASELDLIPWTEANEALLTAISEAVGGVSIYGFRADLDAMLGDIECEHMQGTNMRGPDGFPPGVERAIDEAQDDAAGRWIDAALDAETEHVKAGFDGRAMALALAFQRGVVLAGKAV